MTYVYRSCKTKDEMELDTIYGIGIAVGWIILTLCFLKGISKGFSMQRNPERSLVVERAENALRRDLENTALAKHVLKIRCRVRGLGRWKVFLNFFCLIITAAIIYICHFRN